MGAFVVIWVILSILSFLKICGGIIQYMRDPYFDNAKFLLIMLVVIDHGLFDYLGISVIKTTSIIINSFHMACFIFIAGYFANPKTGAVKIISRYFIPYLIFQPIYYAVGGAGSFSFFTPVYLMWFLLTLTILHLLLPIFVKHLKASIIITLILSLAVAHVKMMSGLSHAVLYLPVFLFGYYAKNNIAVDFPAKAKHLAWCVLPIIAIAVYYIPGIHNLLLNKPASMRFILYLIMVTMCYCFMAVVPKTKTWFTGFGRNTMYVFLLHGIIQNIFFGYITNPVLALVSSVALTIYLSTNIIKTIMWPILEPYKLPAELKRLKSAAQTSLPHRYK